MVIRIDEKGLRVITPGRVDIETEGNLKLSAGAHLILNGDRIFFYGDPDIPADPAGNTNAREVMRNGLSI